MLTYLFASAIYYFLATAFLIIPSGHLPATITNALSSFSPYYGMMLQWFPVDTLLTFIGYVLMVEAGMLVWWIVMRVIHFTRG